MRRWMVYALAMALLAGCPKDDESVDDTGSSADTDTPSNGAGDCTDSAVNPYAGTCVETFVADCFDPSGACQGTVSMTGEINITWDNGAAVESEAGTSGGFTPVVVTELLSSSGAVCATGESTISIGGGGCASETVYTRTSDGAQMTYCSDIQGNLTVTCPDGGSFTVSAADSATASSCQYGGTEPCEMELPF